MNLPALDPALQLTARLGLSLLFGSAAAHKLRDVARFHAAVDGYALLPPLWSVPFGAGLVAAELGVAVGLCLPRVAPGAALIGTALLLMYAGAIGVNLVRGRRDIDCGCAGPARRQPLSAALVVRNALLAAAAVATVLPSGGRPWAWVDAVTVVAGVGAVALLYIATDGLLANAARPLRRSGSLEAVHG